MIWLKWHDSLLLHSTNLMTCDDWVDELFKNHQPIGRPWFFHPVSPLLCRRNFCLRKLWFDWRNIQMRWVGVGHIFKNQTQKISRNFVRHQCVCHQSWDKHTLVLFFETTEKTTSPTLLLAYHVCTPMKLGNQIQQPQPLIFRKMSYHSHRHGESWWSISCTKSQGYGVKQQPFIWEMVLGNPIAYNPMCSWDFANSIHSGSDFSEDHRMRCDCDPGEVVPRKGTIFVPWNLGTILKGPESFANHQFPRDMVVFGGVMKYDINPNCMHVFNLEG